MGKKSKPTHGQKKHSGGNKMAGVKKAKTKTVTTNLKKLNFHNKTKTADLDKEFSDIQKAVLSGKGKKHSTQDESQRQKLEEKPMPPDVDSAMDSMENLTMPNS